MTKYIRTKTNKQTKKKKRGGGTLKTNKQDKIGGLFSDVEVLST